MISNYRHAHHISRDTFTVPDWWYLVLFSVMFTFGVLSIELWHTQMPIWAFMIALLIGKSRILGSHGYRPLLIHAPSRSIHLRHSMWDDSSNHESASRS